MKNRAVRIALFLLAVLAFAGAGYELVLVENRAVAARAAADLFQQKAQRLAVVVRELRAAQYAYVAPGQGPAFWTTRSETLLSAIRADLPNLCGGIGSAGAARDASEAGTKAAAASCAAAQTDLAHLERVDTSVRAYVRGDQRSAAADLVFTDLQEANQALGARLDEIRGSQAAADAPAESALRTRQLATVGGAAVFAVLILLLLTPAGANGAAVGSDSSEGRPSRDRHTSIAPSPPIQALDQSATGSRDGRSITAGGSPGSADAARQPAHTVPDAPVRRPAPANAVGAADLSAAAALCTDFGQLHESCGLPTLLERVAKLLDATGLVVWVDDAACGELRPAVSHGYPPQALARMRGISKADDHATASAYRERVLRVVPGDAAGSGAIAVPLLAPGRCVGVMAAEFRNGRESDRSTQALATIVGAQLATLVTPQPAVTESDGPEMRLIENH